MTRKIRAPVESSNNDGALNEWQVARGVISQFDDRIHDLRKYGFSFITALLAAQSLLMPASTANLAIASAIPDSVKLGVLLVTLLLIVAIRLMEKNYELFQKSAAIRARIIERMLNLELTEMISSRYDQEKMWRYVTGLYYLFAVATGLLGVFILFPNLTVMTILIAGVAVACVCMEEIRRGIQLNLLHFGKYEDWIVDRLEVEQGDVIKITVTNLGDQPISFSPGEVAWKIISEEHGEVIHEEKVKTEVSLTYEDDYSWLWPVGRLGMGIYGVVPRDWPRPLKRKITVTP